MSEPTTTPVLPPGVIVPYAPSLVAPSGWLLCDGSAVSRTLYAGLFAVLGTQYGVGDNVSTFNLPNLKGAVVVGYDAAQTEFNTLGKTGGEKTHVITTAEMAFHGHQPSGGGNFVTSASNSNAGTTIASGGFADSSTTTVGSNVGHNNLQPYIALPYIIKT